MYTIHFLILFSKKKFLCYNIEDYSDDYPYPSCLILGLTISQKSLHVVVGSNGQLAKVITAYYPDPDKWDHDLKTRKAE